MGQDFTDLPAGVDETFPKIAAADVGDVVGELNWDRAIQPESMARRRVLDRVDVSNAAPSTRQDISHRVDWETGVRLRTRGK